MQSVALPHPSRMVSLFEPKEGASCLAEEPSQRCGTCPPQINSPESDEIPRPPLPPLRLNRFQIIVREHQLRIREARLRIHAQLLRPACDLRIAKFLHDGRGPGQRAPRRSSRVQERRILRRRQFPDLAADDILPRAGRGSGLAACVRMTEDLVTRVSCRRRRGRRRRRG